MSEIRIFAVRKKESLSNVVIGRVAVTLEKWNLANTQFKPRKILWI